ncbi:MAG: acyltransferase [Alphaproteobacteria bacterium]|nr:acyltransferase [Alphaproteobacteria bacterium]
MKSVQALRALAALFVVGFHCTLLLHDNFNRDVTPWNNGNAGVDLFFVISGFIMIVSSRSLARQADGWRRFIWLRVVRIVPMYWLSTLTKLALVVAIPELARHTYPTTWNTIASFLFIPSLDGMGVARPVLAVGWTLSFEMFFYIAFAAALYFAIDAVIAVGLLMVVLSLVSLTAQPDWPTFTNLASPFLLEFVFGMIVGRVFLQKRFDGAPPLLAILIGVAGLAGLAVLPADGGWQRATIWGGAACVTLCGALMAERWLGQRLPKLPTETGEASYSLYLTHGFILPVIGVALGKSGLTGLALGVVLTVTGVVFSVVVALVVFSAVEAPITNRLRALVHGRKKVATLASQSVAGLSETVGGLSDAISPLSRTVTPGGKPPATP